MKTNEEFIVRKNISTDLLKWLSMLFDTYNDDFYFPWKNIDKYILAHDEAHNSERIKRGIKNIQSRFINGENNIDLLFQEEFGINI
jgi:hypothetical protein